MSKHAMNTLKVSGGVFGLYCLTLAVAPIASAGDCGCHGAGGGMSAGASNHNVSTPPAPVSVSPSVSVYGGNMSNGSGYGTSYTGTSGGNYNGGGGGKGGSYTWSGGGGSMSGGGGKGGGGMAGGGGYPWGGGMAGGGMTGGGMSGGGGSTPVTPSTPTAIVVGSSSVNSSNAPVNIAPSAPAGYSGTTIGLAQQFQERLAAAQGAYETASQRLAQAGTAQPVASSGPQRYARVPGDLADCGCLNPDTATAPTSSELAAAKVGEAEAAAELAKAKAEARQFLESVKGQGNVAGNASNYSPIW
jgi:hypothetical protein